VRSASRRATRRGPSVTDGINKRSLPLAWLLSNVGVDATEAGALGLAQVGWTTCELRSLFGIGVAVSQAEAPLASLTASPPAAR
jgi:hypothetical protein